MSYALAKPMMTVNSLRGLLISTWVVLDHSNQFHGTCGCVFRHIFQTHRVWLGFVFFLGSATLSKAGKFDFGETYSETDLRNRPRNRPLNSNCARKKNCAKQTPETYHETDPRNRPLRQISRPAHLVLRHIYNTYIYIYVFAYIVQRTQLIHVVFLFPMPIELDRWGRRKLKMVPCRFIEGNGTEANMCCVCVCVFWGHAA